MTAQTHNERGYLIGWALLSLSLVACGGDDEGPGALAPTHSPRPDAGAKPDAGPEDLRRDAGFGDRQPGRACAVEPESLYDLSVTRAVPDVAPLGVQSIAGHFGMAYIDQSETCVDALFVAELRGGASGGGPMVTSAVDECSRIERVALASLADTWLIASSDNRQPPSDVWVQAYDPDADSPEPTYRVTDSPAIEGALSLAVFSDEAAVLAWVERDPQSGEERLLARALSATGEAHGDVVDLTPAGGFTITLPTLARVGNLIGLAYHRAHADGRSQVVLERLNPDTAARVGDPWVATEAAGPEPSVALATDAQGGALLYSEAAAGSGRQLWFQRLDERGEPARSSAGAVMGAPSEPERLVNSPFRAIDGSMTRLVTGYAVAYRALPGGTVSTPSIKLLFLDNYGRVVGDSAIAETTEQGGRTSIVFSIEGRMVMGWSDRTDAGTVLRMMRVPCVGDG